VATAALARQFSAWGPPISAETWIAGTSAELNTASQDGCPILSPDGLDLYMASNRPGYVGASANLDIWVAHRTSRSAPWGAPVNLGAPVNSDVDDFCPTPTLGGGLFFVSARVVAGACGGPDIYFTRMRHGSWTDPQNLGCRVNSAAGEAGPSLILEGLRSVLYFSSTRAGGFSAETPGAVSGDSDIYASPLTKAGFGQARLVRGLNTPANDSRPNVRHDGREIVFDSDRDSPTVGVADIYSATRRRCYGAWSTPVSLGPTVNTAANESRASFSWDGTILLFGSNRPGSEGTPPSGDIYVATRLHIHGRF
jgi:WD40-like Beta Propeller Repeat